MKFDNLFPCILSSSLQEETKNSLRRGRKRKRDVVGQRESAPSEAEDAKGVKPNPKRVSFA